MATTTVTQTATETLELQSVPNAGPDRQLETAPSTPKEKMSPGTMIKILSAGLAFFVSGVSDGSIGTIIPYAIRDYGITTTIVSSV